MKLTEKEARGKICHEYMGETVARTVEAEKWVAGQNEGIRDMSDLEALERIANRGYAACVGSFCMAWRWFDPEEWAVRTGYCGKAGRPLSASEQDGEM